MSPTVSSTSWLSRAGRVLALATTLALGTTLAACSGFTPVYGDYGLARQSVDVAYAPPTSRLEQIIYQDLALRLGKSTAPGARRVTVTTSEGTRDLTRNTVTAPSIQREATVFAHVTLTAPDGQVLLSVDRSATADFTENTQVLANQSARTDALERAAHALADTIRLTLLATLAAPAP